MRQSIEVHYDGEKVRFTVGDQSRVLNYAQLRRFVETGALTAEPDPLAWAVVVDGVIAAVYPSEAEALRAAEAVSVDDYDHHDPYGCLILEFSAALTQQILAAGIVN